MKKKNPPVSVVQLAALAVGFYVFDKFGGVRALQKQAKVITGYPPIAEIGHMTQAAWQLKYGGSYTDYQDWLRGV